MKSFILWAARAFGYEPVPAEKIADWAKTRRDLAEKLEDVEFEREQWQATDAALRAELTTKGGLLALEQASLSVTLNKVAELERERDSLAEQLNAVRAAHMQDHEIYRARLDELERREASIAAQLCEAREAHEHTRKVTAARIAELETAFAGMEADHRATRARLDELANQSQARVENSDSIDKPTIQ